MLKAWNQHGEIIYNREIGKYYISEFGFFFPAGHLVVKYLPACYALKLYTKPMLSFYFTLKKQCLKESVLEGTDRLYSTDVHSVLHNQIHQNFYQNFSYLKISHISSYSLGPLCAETETEDSCKYGWQEMAFCTRTQKEWYILVNSLFYFTFP